MRIEMFVLIEGAAIGKIYNPYECNSIFNWLTYFLTEL